ncbi:hypothetical protein [Tranquillimonas alkanivorans]|uniref:Uncharacterized protein n=1 Tax=Tranquillimonas alkanivorans TaxID=441119 RepID=A0A1I5R9J2_9RHOB|nr:hypothetical protein [Tranquillimonas alkanivorans]SFP55202.1 hypothetical protein SAMN04488047_10864 [Tranquillimonas alkanivorans]
MTDHRVLIILILLPFVVIFARAMYLEVRRYLKYGASQNNRASFPIDENAPSYQPPPEEAEEDTDPDAHQAPDKK